MVVCLTTKWSSSVVSNTTMLTEWPLQQQEAKFYGHKSTFWLTDYILISVDEHVFCFYWISARWASWPGFTVSRNMRRYTFQLLACQTWTVLIVRWWCTSIPSMNDLSITDFLNSCEFAFSFKMSSLRVVDKQKFRDWKQMWCAQGSLRLKVYTVSECISLTKIFLNVNGIKDYFYNFGQIFECFKLGLLTLKECINSGGTVFYFLTEHLRESCWYF